MEVSFFSYSLSIVRCQKVFFYFLALLFLIIFFGCSKVSNKPSKKDIAIQRSIAATKAAEAETRKLKAELKLEKEKFRIENERILKLAEQKLNKTKMSFIFRQKVKTNSVNLVKRDGNAILMQAYPLAGNLLSYKFSELVGMSENGQGFSSIVRLHYSNLFNKPHYLDIRIIYDKQAGLRSWKIINYTDIIAPNELTISSLLKYAMILP